MKLKFSRHRKQMVSAHVHDIKNMCEGLIGMVEREERDESYAMYLREIEHYAGMIRHQVKLETKNATLNIGKRYKRV